MDQMDYGIKVMKAGYSYTNTDIRNILMSSKYSMLKFHSSSSVNISVTQASPNKNYVDVSHDLGYVPYFLVYRGVLTDTGENGANDTLQRFIPTLFSGSGGDISVYAFADSSKVRVIFNLADFNPDGGVGDSYSEDFSAGLIILKYLLNIISIYQFHSFFHHKISNLLIF